MAKGSQEEGPLLPFDEPSVEEVNWTGSGSPAEVPRGPGNLQLNFNQQINFFGEIQGFDNLEKLSPEVRGAALDYLRTEQQARLSYVSSEQKHRHSLEQRGQTAAFSIQSRAMITTALVFVFSLAVCGYLLTRGQGVAAIGILVGEIAAAAGMVIYGNRKAREQPKTEESKSDGK